MDRTLRDFRFGVRMLIRAPGFALTAILILGLAIGANSTMFTLINSLFLEPPPGVTDPGRLVRVNRTTEYSRSGSLSYPDYVYYRDHNDVFSGLTAYGGAVPLMAGSGEGAVQVEAWVVAGNYFDVLGVRPLLGRTFLPDEDRVPGEDPVAVVSHSFWRTRLNGETDVIGRSIHLNGRPFTVIGVAPPEFRGISPTDSPPDLWVPIHMQPVVMPTGGDMLHRVEGEIQVWLQAIGRLKPGVGPDAARANLLALAGRLEEEFPEWTEGTSVGLTPHFQYRPGVRSRLLGLARVLTTAVALVLLIACANLAILLLARASKRREELGVRLALGAGRGQLVNQLLSEGLLLALAGGVVGLALAMWFSDLAALLLPVPLHVEVDPDLAVAGYTLGLCVVTTVLFGLAPAWLASRWNIADFLRAAGRTTERSLLRGGLVITQMALAVCLLSGAGLFLRSFLAAHAVDLGFQTENRLLMQVNLRSHGYGEEEGKAFIREALRRVSNLPGVVNASTTRMVPFRGIWTGGVQAQGVEAPSEYGTDVGLNAVGPDYFRAMGIPLIAGRDIGVSDHGDAARVAVVNETLARRLWPGEDPIGKLVGREPLWFRVVGMARDATYYELGEEPQTQLYLPVLQFYQPRVNLVAHTRGDPATVAGALEREVRSLDPTLVISEIRTLEDLFAGSVGSYRVLAMLVSLFGALALILAAVGLYGVLSYLVSQRTRELGIRIALGADPARLTGAVLKRGLTLAVIGVVVGGTAALLASQAVDTLLFGVEPHDPLAFGLAPLVLTGIALLAAYLPARRAARVDPMEALRYE